MISKGDVDPYRSRAREWQQEAERTSDRQLRETYLLIAQGYADLATLLETTRCVH